MNARIQLYIWMLVLTAVGLGSAAYTHWGLGFPLVPGEVTTVWTVEAKVSASTVTVAGQVIGDISAAEKIELAPTAKVQGNIDAQTKRLYSGNADRIGHASPVLPWR